MRLGVECALVAGDLVHGDVEVAGGRISAVGLNGRPGKGIAAPGFVDLQVNGFAGVDFLSADARAYPRAGAALLRTGVTAFQPTLITSTEDELEAALREVPANGAAPHVLGAHLEGPFLAPERLGAHPAISRRDPDVALLERLLAAGPVAHMTLAPELPGALDLVARVLLDPGDAAWVEDPGYSGARGALLAAGAKLVAVPIDEGGLDVDAGRLRRRREYEHEERIPREALHAADEVFFTGTAAEITPIRSVDRIQVGNGRRGPITSFVQDTFMGICEGRLPDPYGWRTPVPTGAHAGI